MKKSLNILAACLFVFAGLFASCVNAVADDGEFADSRLVKGYKNVGGGTAPFRSVTGASVQIWENSFELGDADDDEVCLNITKTPGWWGGAYGYFDNGAQLGAYDLSKVRSVSVQVMASTECKVIFGLVTNKWGVDENGKTGWLSDKHDVNVTTSYNTIEIELNDDVVLCSETGVLFQVMNGTIGAGESLYIKDFAFFDANGNEVVPMVK